MQMSRLADYFVIVGYDHSKERKLQKIRNQFCICGKTGEMSKSKCLVTGHTGVNNAL